MGHKSITWQHSHAHSHLEATWHSFRDVGKETDKPRGNPTWTVSEHEQKLYKDLNLSSG